MINDPRPIRLMPADQADDIPMLLIELNQHVRNVRDDALRARDLHTRAQSDESGRLRSRVQAELIDVHEGAARTCDLLETLTRSLRANGRL
jgi:hypothetical protein